jgi:hypothetical protein
MTQRASDQRQRQEPLRNDVNLPETQKKNRFSHAVPSIGVMAFIAHALPAMFDRRCDR